MNKIQFLSSPSLSASPASTPKRVGFNGFTRIARTSALETINHTALRLSFRSLNPRSRGVFSSSSHQQSLNKQPWNWLVSDVQFNKEPE